MERSYGLSVRGFALGLVVLGALVGSARAQTVDRCTEPLSAPVMVFGTSFADLTIRDLKLFYSGTWTVADSHMASASRVKGAALKSSDGAWLDVYYGREDIPDSSVSGRVYRVEYVYPDSKLSEILGSIAFRYGAPCYVLERGPSTGGYRATFGDMKGISILLGQSPPYLFVTIENALLRDRVESLKEAAAGVDAVRRAAESERRGAPF